MINEIGHSLNPTNLLIKIGHEIVDDIHTRSEMTVVPALVQEVVKLEWNTSVELWRNGTFEFTILHQ